MARAALLTLLALSCASPAPDGRGAASAGATPGPESPKASDRALLRFLEPLGPRAVSSRAEASSQLARSRDRWEQLRGSWGAQYRYLRSVEDGQRVHNTLILVQQGRVAERVCDTWLPGELVQHRVETGAELGAERACHLPLTVEQLYERCQALIDRAADEVVLELHESGVLAACALPPARCGHAATDCVTLRWAWEPQRQRPCIASRGAYPHGAIRRQDCSECRCENGMESCTDSVMELCAAPAP